MDSEFHMTPVLAILIVALSILLGYLVTGWYHRLNYRINIQKAQLYLLAKIAEKHGVEEKEIISAIDHSNGYKTLEGKI